MEVGWQLKEAVTKQFMTSFVQKSLEYFLYKPHNVIHTYIHHGSTYVFNVLKIAGQFGMRVFIMLLILIATSCAR